MGRLNMKNLKEYLFDTYGTEDFIEKSSHTLSIRGLKQSDFGGEKDCVLASISTVVWYYLRFETPIEDIYNYTEELGKKTFYKETVGTPALSVKFLLDRVLAHFNLPTSKKQYLGKGCLGYNFKTIKTQINNGKPIILSMSNDGRDFYKRHTVTIVGYRQLEVAGKEVPILVILDNWTKLFSYIDYNKLSIISSINF